MAWWEEERPALEDQLADSSRPIRAARPDDDASAGWAMVPVWLVLGLALVAAGVAVLVIAPGFAVGAFGVALVAWGGFFLSQYGVLGWYALQVSSLRERRVTAERLGEPAPALTDLDVRSWRVPLSWAFGRLRVGLLGPGDGAAPRALRITRVVGGCCATVLFAAGALGVLAGTLAEAVA